MTALSIKPKELSREPIQESDSPTMSLPQDGTEPLAGRRHESGGTIPEVVSPWPQKRFYGHSKWISYARRRGLASTPMVAGGYYIDPEFSPTLATTAEEPQQVLSLEPAPMVATVHAIPTAPTIQESYRIVQCWEGTVTDLDATSFIAQLRDQTNREHPLEQAEFSRDEVDEDDLKLLQLGAVFYWSIGYHHQANGSRRL